MDKVFKGFKNENQNDIVKIRIRDLREPIIGDKFCLSDDTEILCISSEQKKWKLY